MKTTQLFGSRYNKLIPHAGGNGCGAIVTMEVNPDFSWEPPVTEQDLTDPHSALVLLATLTHANTQSCQRSGCPSGSPHSLLVSVFISGSQDSWFLSPTIT